MATFFSDAFNVHTSKIEAYGAFDVSLITDLPLFIDPFLLFHSKKPEYQKLHKSIINYLGFLKNKAAQGDVDDALLRYWYCFPEVKQNWFGFTKDGNDGSGLGMRFARALHANLRHIFSEFGSEQITQSSHLEKVCLIADKVGKDSISDFTTNLIKEYLCEYTQTFAKQNLDPSVRKKTSVDHVRFNYNTESWESDRFELPWFDGDFVLLTPIDMLTKDENWINQNDLVEEFEVIPTAIPDDQIRSRINNYFQKALTTEDDRAPTKKERKEAALATIEQFPELIDYYIKYKEDNGSAAEKFSESKRRLAELFFRMRARSLQELLSTTSFYDSFPKTYEESHDRIGFLKDVIENKGGHRAFYDSKGLLVTREEDIQIMFRLVWKGSPSTVTREANDGRGPVDFKISRGVNDVTLVEFKLASNTQLKRNLQKQVEIYQAASDAQKGIKVILFFDLDQEARVKKILKDLDLGSDPDIVLIDACNTNKPSGSKA